MGTYHVDVKVEKRQVQPTIDDIDEFFREMHGRNCQFVVCVMSGRNEDDLKQLKADIKDCGTMKYGK
jgi:hypothetical protein